MTELAHEIETGKNSSQKMSIRWIGNDDKILSTLTTVFQFPNIWKSYFLWVYYIAFMCPDLVHQLEQWTGSIFSCTFHSTPFLRHAQNKWRNERTKQQKEENFKFIHYKRIREHIDHNSNGQTHLNPIGVSNIFVGRCRLSSESAFLRWQFVSN